MKIIISENKLVDLINKTLGDKMSPILIITNYWESDILVRRMFGGDIHTFNDLLNHWGPMYFIKTPKNGKWLVQQRKGGEWFIYKAGHHPDSEYGVRIDEDELLSKMGLSMLGIPLDVIIDNFAYEY